MFSLEVQDISTSSTNRSALETFEFISRSDASRSMVPMEITRFEWVFGWNYRSFPYDSEYNIVAVSDDLASLLRQQLIRIVPTAEVIQLAYDIQIYNSSIEALQEGRRLCEEFGRGPWEYIILPGQFNEARKPCFPLSLYHHTPDGTNSLRFDPENYFTLPRVTLNVHPTIIIMRNFLEPPEGMYFPNSLREHAIIPLFRIIGAWPLWTHNQFLASAQATSKRKRSRSTDSTSISCSCSHCVPTLDPVSSSVGLSSISLIEQGNLAGCDENRGQPRCESTWKVVEWVGSMKPSPVDELVTLSQDRLLQDYAQESSLDPESAETTRSEEDEKRLRLAGPILLLEAVETGLPLLP